MRKTQIYLTYKQHKFIADEAKYEEVSFSERIRRAIDNYIQKDYKKSINQLIKLQKINIL